MLVCFAEAREAEAGKLEFAAGTPLCTAARCCLYVSVPDSQPVGMREGKGTCLEHWLQQPVECSGNLHSRGLMQKSQFCSGVEEKWPDERELDLCMRACCPGPYGPGSRRILPVQR